MNFKVNIMVDTGLARKARLYANLNGTTPEAVAETALAKFLATDPRIDEADAALEKAKAQAWRELKAAWAETPEREGSAPSEKLTDQRP